ncbi:hypothetical protein [Streptacidiphilus rugosus]|uniref:hypothetical protein n=1 Tax=Streptacidiphilus rugosus TaxID=405783 RepID=UPI000564509B|nr:hypothetical protein [Streptacidiphilus rugosus]
MAAKGSAAKGGAAKGGAAKGGGEPGGGGHSAGRGVGHDAADHGGRAEPRNPLLDPRLAGAGGLLIAGAAVAWMVTQGTHHDPAPTPPSPSPVVSVR